ncbi:hypothetical protein J3A64_003283 [Pseudarthrobacter sp. PvP004]|uniref:hypothetical protein n=1 Tax=Pseudarthrobacter sp. PvP004 TaxID=2817850 RepID=UPI001AE2714F|nr:hypothetical protein [Pseudarthrobacter sp. PvP004]MBP2267819.1 hypothetical protein [Pseudarthrobacter sp. PvP004]
MTVPVAAGLVSAVVAIQKADASTEAAARAEAAQDTAQRASRAAHFGLAFQGKPKVAVWWFRPMEGFTHWDLQITSDRPAKDIDAEWHFADGRPPVKASFPEITPEAGDPFNRSAVRLVVPLGLPASVELGDIHKHLVRGTLEYTDAVGMARWRATWRYLPLSPEEETKRTFLNAPKAAYKAELVDLLKLPDDL